MDTERIPSIGGPADASEFPREGRSLFVFVGDTFAVAHRYDLCAQEDGLAYVYVGPEPLDAIATPVAGWRL